MLITLDFEKENRSNFLISSAEIRILFAAQDLHLELGKSVKLSFQDSEGTFVQTGFKVEGIFNTQSGSFDKSNVFVLRNDLEKLVGVQDYFHEVAVILNDFQQAKAVAEAINQQEPDLTARTWAQLSPELSFRDEISGAALMVILVIIVFALSFGILNTMLMAVLERKEETGMLMAVGMKRIQVFKMILSDNTTFLVGRKGTGKSTIILRLESEYRKKDDYLPCYIDTKTVFESTKSEYQNLDYLKGRIPDEALGK